MNYHWYDLGVFEKFGLRVIDIEFKVLKHEDYEDYDYPNKKYFNHPWQKWQGVDVEFMFEKKILNGYRGKTVWYIPALDEDMASTLKIKKGQALKIIKYPVHSKPEQEYLRLMHEHSIQKVLAQNHMAAEIYEIVLVRNFIKNEVWWFDEKYFHNANAIYFAQIVENIEIAYMDQEVDLDSEYYFTGKRIDEFKSNCEQLGIQHYDIGLGNLFCDKNGTFKIVDVHKWVWLFDLSEKEFPDYLQIELNNTCNANCKMCAIPTMKRKRGLMRDDLFTRVLLDARASGIKNIIPFLHGEPFIRDDFLLKLKQINEILPDATITIFTNASKMSHEIVNKLKDIRNIIRINFSFPGGDNDTYTKITKLDYEKVKRNISYALNTLTCNMTVTMPVFCANQGSEVDFLKLWSSYNSHTYKSYNYIDHTTEPRGNCEYTPCSRIFTSMTVLWNGQVSLCCMDAEGRFIYGDLNKQSIIDVWKSDELVKIRKTHSINRELCIPCKDCDQIMLPPQFQAQN